MHFPRSFLPIYIYKSVLLGVRLVNKTIVPTLTCWIDIQRLSRFFSLFFLKPPKSNQRRRDILLPPSTACCDLPRLLFVPV